MDKITLTYPTSGLVVSLVLTNTTTEVVDFSWVANEIGTTGVYVYSFTGAASTDYAYVATVTGYKAMSWIIYQDNASAWWLTPTQEQQLDDTFKKTDMLLNLWKVSLPI